MTAEELTARYLENKAKIEQLEGENVLVRENLMQLLPYDPQKTTHQLEAGKVEWCKGRTTSKTDNVTLRRLLAMDYGVPLHVIEEVYEKATTVTVGAPSIRVTRNE